MGLSVGNAINWGDMKGIRKIVKYLSMFDGRINSSIFKVIIKDLISNE